MVISFVSYMVMKSTSIHKDYLAWQLVDTFDTSRNISKRVAGDKLKEG